MIIREEMRDQFLPDSPKEQQQLILMQTKTTSTMMKREKLEPSNF